MDTLPSPAFATYAGHNIAYYSHGAGPAAVVFLHGWTCDSALWLPQQGPLITSFPRALLVDYLGHGASAAPQGVEYGMETLARSAKAALDHAGVEKAMLVAHSMGGQMALMLLRLWPELVAGIVFVDSFFRNPQHYMTLAELADSRTQFADDAFFERWARGTCAGLSEEGVVERVAARMTRTPRHVRVSCIGTTERPHAWRWDEVFGDVPALQVATVFKDVDPFWRHHMPQLEVLKEGWEDCGHFLFLDRPERFNQVVGQWMRETRLI